MTESGTATGAATGAEPVGGEPIGTVLTARFTRAFDLARVLHPDFRKGGVDESGRPRPPVPYLSHPMFVAATVLEHGGSEEEAIAALLHDSVEDAGGLARLGALRVEFGDEVADIVSSLSDSMTTDEHAKPPWWDRKVTYLRHLEHDPDVLPGAHLVCAADKLANLTATRIDRDRDGPPLWGVFNVGRDGQLWYYTRLRDILRDRITTTSGAELVERFAAQVEGLWDDIVADEREGVTRAQLEMEYEVSLATERDVLASIGR